MADGSPPPPPSGDDLVGRIQELLKVKEAYTSNTLPPAATKAAVVKFWRKMRSVLAVNPSSAGLHHLDEIATALLENDDAAAADFFDSLIVLVPDSARQRSGRVPPDHEVFTENLKRPRSTSPPPTGAVLVPKKGSHVKKLKLDFGVTADAKSSKSVERAEKLPVEKKTAKTTRSSVKAAGKRKKSPPSSKLLKAVEAMETDDDEAEDTGTTAELGELMADPELTAELEQLEADLAEFVDFPVSKAAALAVKRAVVKLYKEAKGNGQVLALKAYPWRGQYLFYDPSESPDVHLVHWRWWMNGRLAFFLWGLNVPLEGRVAQAARRRKKSDAIAGRIEFVSFMIETWGWYGTLHRVERSGHRQTFWWGGQPGRNQPSSEYKGPKIMDLGVLLKKDGIAFLQRLRDARKPGRLDREGFRDLPSLLALTGAIDPDDKGERSPELRLSDRALARVLLDVTSTLQVPAHWAGNITEGVWLALTKSERIRDLRITIEKELAAGTYVAPTVEPYDPAESEVEDVTPFKNRDGSYTALPPENKVAPWSYKQGDVIDVSEDDDQEEGEVDETPSSTSVSTHSGRAHSFIRPLCAKGTKSKSK